MSERGRDEEICGFEILFFPMYSASVILNDEEEENADDEEENAATFNDDGVDSDVSVEQPKMKKTKKNQEFKKRNCKCRGIVQ